MAMFRMFSSRLAGAVARGTGDRPVGLNVFILPADTAYPFIAWCYANYASGAVVDFSDRGSPLLFADTATPVDVRTAAARYDVMKADTCSRTPADLIADWSDDLVAVGIGCSVVVDHAMTAAGIGLKHIARSVALAVYETAVPTRAVGPFSARQHVSMRIVKKAQADDAVAVTGRYPVLHGAPVHVGDAAELGIADLAKPVLGAGLMPDDDEICLFWGCGVTLRAALSGTVFWMANSEGSLVATPFPISAFRTPDPRAPS